MMFEPNSGWVIQCLLVQVVWQNFKRCYIINHHTTIGFNILYTAPKVLVIENPLLPNGLLWSAESLHRPHIFLEIRAPLPRFWSDSHGARWKNYSRKNAAHVVVFNNNPKKITFGYRGHHFTLNILQIYFLFSVVNLFVVDPDLTR